MLLSLEPDAISMPQPTSGKPASVKGLSAATQPNRGSNPRNCCAATSRRSADDGHPRRHRSPEVRSEPAVRATVTSTAARSVTGQLPGSMGAPH